MPPKKKETEEEKEAKFASWKEGPEYLALKKLSDVIGSQEETRIVEVASKDIWSDWAPVLDAIKGVMEAFKVPKKTQSKSLNTNARRVRAAHRAYHVLRQCDRALRD